MSHSIWLRLMNGGTPGEYLTDLQGEAQLTLTRDAAGQLEFNYPTWGAASDKIMDSLVIVAEIDGEEREGCRFIYQNRTGDRTDPKENVHYTFRQFYDGVRTGQWRPPTNTAVSRSWTKAKAGQIIMDTWIPTRNRGNFLWFAPIQFDFTTVADSSGREWPKEITVELEYGDKSVWDVWDWLRSNGYVEFWSNRSVVQAFVPGNHGVDRYSTQQLVLYEGTDIKTAPYETDTDDLVTHLLVTFDPIPGTGISSAEVTLLPPDAPLPMGRREAALHLPGIKPDPQGPLDGILLMPQTVSQIAQEWLTVHGQEREQRSFELVSQARAFPLKDFTIGDTVGFFVGNTLYRDRVVAVSITWDGPYSMKPIVTTNDWLDERDRRLEARLSKLRGN